MNECADQLDSYAQEGGLSKSYFSAGLRQAIAAVDAMIAERDRLKLILARPAHAHLEGGHLDQPDPDCVLCESIKDRDALIEVAKRARPFLQDEADQYADDGSNEPLETLRDLDAAIARLTGEGA